ncbi:uncharacterized protein [Primulina eburnea]|uniref:uncharacterized protein n=1 Tax=Primulina eburnea TaxID=1245227 RepID=UPI003C6C8711
MSLDLNVTHLDDEYVDDETNKYDHYFDRTLVSNDHCTDNDILEDINTSTENMEENDVICTENDVEDIDAVHVDDNDVNIHHISVAHDSRYIFICRCWRIWTSKQENSTDFVICTYFNTHNCDLTGMRKRHRKASSSIVCDMLVENFQGQPKIPQPKSIMTMMRNKEVEITYNKALKGKQLSHDIFRGDSERSFGLLLSYLKMIERMNPGSIIDLVVDKYNRFKCMKKVVSIDGIWLKGKYDGTLLVASAQDRDFHQYPLAWAVVDLESIASWGWFLSKLLEVVVDEKESVIILDRNPGIIAAVADVYKNAHHGHCI